jgi:hypothetical protein
MEVTFSLSRTPNDKLCSGPGFWWVAKRRYPAAVVALRLRGTQVRVTLTR